LAAVSLGIHASLIALHQPYIKWVSCTSLSSSFPKSWLYGHYVYTRITNRLSVSLKSRGCIVGCCLFEARRKLIEIFDLIDISFSLSYHIYARLIDVVWEDFVLDVNLP
jgi:hypothetical protein